MNSREAYDIILKKYPNVTDDTDIKFKDVGDLLLKIFDDINYKVCDNCKHADGAFCILHKCTSTTMGYTCGSFTSI